MNHKKSHRLAFLILLCLSSCNYRLFVKAENILYTGTGYFFEFRNEYFLMPKKLPDENVVDINYIVKDMDEPFVKIESFYFGQEVSFYEKIKFLEKAPIVINARKLGSHLNMPLAATDSVSLVPVEVEYRKSSSAIDTENVSINKYDDFFFKDEKSQRLIKFEFDKKKVIDVVSISLPYGRMKLRSSDTAFIFGN